MTTSCSIDPAVQAIPQINVKDLSSKLKDVQIVDVRRPDEFNAELGHIGGAILATLETDLSTYLEKLSKNATYVFVCRSGGRSSTAAKMAVDRGFQKVFNMAGGMLAWNEAGLPVER